MTPCQPFKREKITDKQYHSISCGACCGILNLALSKHERILLLNSRTHAIEKILKDCCNQFIEENLLRKKFFQQAGKYRQEQEKIENSIRRFNKETYCCVFLGFLSRDKRRIGCLIHPDKTKIKNSQNASFYGTSICTNYDCKFKSNKLSSVWTHFFINFCSKNKLDSWDYMLLTCDSVTLHHIGVILELKHRLKEFSQSDLDKFFTPDEASVLNRFFHLRLNKKYTRKKLFNLTSLEIVEENNLLSKKAAMHFLVSHLSNPCKSNVWKERIEELGVSKKI
jgi:hypothetical protein